MNLIDKCLNRGHRPKIVLIDSSYGNNRHFVQQLESKIKVHSRSSKESADFLTIRLWRSQSKSEVR
ncbi:MAG: hypothetical protein CLLPBCKN_004113 [Chroococcidiopsis cubana SAG 39.79]|nr:hypothetical protein [Chroococcidiopsis cubana SAG 39.79]